MAETEKEIMLCIPPLPYRRLQAWAERVGKTPESLTREIVEQALAHYTPPPSSQTTRQILEATGRVCDLSPTLRRMILPNVTLEEVRASLANAGGPPLSEIILQQRAPKS